MCRRIAAGVAAVACAAAVAPGAALGATVSHPSSARIDFAASAGEANRVTVSFSGTNLLVADRGPPGLSPADDCGPTSDPQVVTCPAAGITALQLTGGDGDDELTNATGLPAQAFGDDGHDVLRGGSAADRLDGGAGPDQLEGADGNDVLQGGDGSDSVIGGGGDDMEDGGAGDDTVGAETSAELGNDALVGGPGNDTLVPGPGPPLADADSLVGGDGFDAVSYGPRMTPVAVSKNGAADDGEMTESDNVGLDVERIRGGAASDTLSGGPGPDVLEGGPGDDAVTGLEGDDSLLGDAGPGDGTDRLAGGPGADVIQGEGGGDTLAGDDGADSVQGGAGDDTLAGDDGNDSLQGGPGADTLSGGPGADDVLGGPDRDVVAYTTEANVRVRLDAGTGATSAPGDRDRIAEVEDVSGGDRRDTLTGSQVANVLDGDVGEDYVDGQRGVDRLDGGRSPDVVAARDGARDEPVSCGPGRDLAIVDRSDRVVRRGPNRCEQVDDTRDTTPSPGRVYVQPRSCAGSATDAGLGLPAMRRRVPLRYSLLLRSGYRRRPSPMLDAADCTVRLTATTGRRDASADISGAAAAVRQRGRRTVTTELTVERPGCAGRVQSRAAAAGTSRLRVNARRGRGRWHVRGNFSIGASFGTDWTTVESCSSTTTIVRSGKVRVFDRAKRRTVTVRAGHRYVARR